MQPGTRLGPYEVLSPLGAGGMGERNMIWKNSNEDQALRNPIRKQPRFRSAFGSMDPYWLRWRRKRSVSEFPIKLISAVSFTGLLKANWSIERP